jgi:hypothetical protein
MAKKTPIEMLTEATAQAEALTASIEAMKTEHAQAVSDLTAQVTALTGERDTLKAEAEKAATEKAAADTARAESDKAVADLSAKLTVAEQKLKDPALLAAAGKEAAKPVEGLTGGDGGSVDAKSEQLAKLEKQYAAEKDPVVKGRIRRELVELKNK